MPTYEYQCLKCHKKFEIAESISEHEAKRKRCPKCKSVRVERLFGGFFAKTSKKS